MPFNSLKVIRNVSVVILFCLLVFIIHDYKFTSLYKLNEAHFVNKTHDNNLWCIFTKANENYRLRSNFRRFANSLFLKASIPLDLNIISDTKSVEIANTILNELKPNINISFTVQYHNVHKFADELEDIVHTMQLHFSSQPGSYYSDALFFLSIGLHRATKQNRAVMMDIDTELRVDIRELFEQFDKMSSSALVAAAPEQSPVYRHALHMYRAANRESSFGNPISYKGNPGLNSGVLLLHLEKQRQSHLYQKMITKKNVARLCEKYQFHGHLGDQDWYTLMSEEHPNLVHILDCTWNRQLCLWWRHHGYHDIFDLFHYCPGEVKIYHGNCNTEIPSS